MNNLKEKYEKEIKKKLKLEFDIKNDMSIPKLTKIVVNTGIGDAVKDKKIIESVSDELATITGQKPSVRKAKVSVASFTVRKGMPVGLKVTLRGDRMYFFLEKLIKISLPRLRDFRGISRKAFDSSGNYTLGIREHSIFPEIDLSKTNSSRGMEVTFVTSTNERKEAERLLELFGMPFEKEEKEEREKKKK